MPASAPHFYAHSTADPSRADWQLLRDHLAGVAKLARSFAEATGVAELSAAAEAAGWLHDLGKYRESFQKYIRGLPPLGSKQHKEAGAAWAARLSNLPLSFAILGHHHGMPDPDNAKTAVKGSDGLAVIAEVETTALGECPQLKTLPIPKRGGASSTAELFTRLLLSCHVDADWTDGSARACSGPCTPMCPSQPPLEAAPAASRSRAFPASIPSEPDLPRRAHSHRPNAPEAGLTPRRRSARARSPSPALCRTRR